MPTSSFARAQLGRCGLLSLTLLIGCLRHPAPPSSATKPIVFSVATSAHEVMEQAAARFRAETGLAVTLNAGASNALAVQITNGAAVDLFLAASPEWAETLRDDGQLAEEVSLLANRLVLVVPRGNPASIKTPIDLITDKVQRVAIASENVPAGKYGEQALRQAGVWDTLVNARKLARGHDVRATLAFVERGEAEAGIVYATDLSAARDAELASEFSPSSHEPIVYPLVLLKRGAENAAARRLFDYLQTDAATEFFLRAGFQRVPRVQPRRN